MDPSQGYCRAVGLASLVLLIGLFLVHALQYDFIIDDAYISFRYAQHLVEGQGLVFNPGERVEGYSNLLWVLSLAAGMWAGIAPELLARTLGIGSAVVGLVLVWRLALRHLPEQPARQWLALLPVAMLATNRSYAAWATGGLETRCFAVLVLWSVLQLDAETERSVPWSAVPMVLLLGMRVDGFVPVGVMLLWLLVRRGGKPGRHGIQLAAVIAAAIAALETFRLSYYGDWLPNTFYVKVPEPALGAGLDYLTNAALDYGLPLPLLLGAFAVVRLRRRRGIAGLLLALCLAQLGYVGAVGGDHFEYRLLDPVWPLAALLVLFGITALRPATHFWKRRAAFAMILLVVVWNGRPALSGFPDNDAVRSIEQEAAFCRQWDRIGRWFERSAAPDEIIALRPVGVIPYRSGLRSMDMHGLTDREIARRPPNAGDVAGHRKLATWEDMLIRGRANYILDHPYVTEVRPEPLPPRIVEAGGRRFVLLPVYVDLDEFWLTFFIVSEEAVTDEGIDVSRVTTKIRPGHQARR